MRKERKMANKVHPQALIPSAPCYFTSKQETFTIWMKSLVLSGKGCTVFDSDGHVVYRVDNYNCKDSNQVHLMDFKGHVLFTFFKKKFKLLDCWDGYRASGNDEIDRKKPGFQVRRKFRLSGHACRAVVRSDQNQSRQYSIESNWTSKSTCRIADKAGVLIAEVKRKQSENGVVLGEDVLTMVVEPSMDHSLIMALLVVYNLIISRM
ncbi:protein LURP-one-related 11-like [Euphorbia lathyris]|uniref:protein LURP-one-related 11-like n=1 Tax=Euphorbia lathyris TaxID=212925 RepID=UPI00331419AB